jgi:hypothetical protein
VLNAAAGSESSWDGEEDNFLLGPFCVTISISLSPLVSGQGARGLRRGASDGWKEKGRDWRKEGEGRTFASIIINWDTARRDIRALLLVRDVAEDDVAGQAISNLE